MQVEIRAESDVLDLAGALWSAGLEPEADRVLTAAPTESAVESGRLADSLLAIGQQDRAFALHLRVKEAVARRPVPALVRLLETMHEADHDEDAVAILGARVEDAIAPQAASSSAALQSLAELCAELGSAGLGPYASAVLRRSAVALPPAGVIELAEALYRQGRGEDCVPLFLTATRANPSDLRAVAERSPLPWPSRLPPCRPSAGRMRPCTWRGGQRVTGSTHLGGWS
jgi:hypothetical protein